MQSLGGQRRREFLLAEAAINVGSIQPRGLGPVGMAVQQRHLVVARARQLHQNAPCAVGDEGRGRWTAQTHRAAQPRVEPCVAVDSAAADSALVHARREAQLRHQVHFKGHGQQLRRQIGIIQMRQRPQRDEKQIGRGLLGHHGGLQQLQPVHAVEQPVVIGAQLVKALLDLALLDGEALFAEMKSA